MHKKIAENFTNTFPQKCAIIISVGASMGFSTPFYYTYIYKRKAAEHVVQPLFCVKIFLKKKVFSYTFFIMASAAAHRVASQAAAASGVSPMAVM